MLARVRAAESLSGRHGVLVAPLIGATGDPETKPASVSRQASFRAANSLLTLCRGR
jgi:hypothetical protein